MDTFWICEQVKNRTLEGHKHSALGQRNHTGMLMLRWLQKMDLSKYLLEKILHYVAGVIPGIIALVLFECVAPGALRGIFNNGFLGYRTTVALTLLLAFIIGNTLSTCLSIILIVFVSVMAAITVAIRERQSYKDRHAYDPAPWRDPKWRALAKKHLGDRAPNDTLLEPRKAFDFRRRLQEILPEKARTVSIPEMDAQRNNLEQDDQNWAYWYQHHHDLVIQEEDRSFESYVRKGLVFNFETAAVFLIVCSFCVPSVRHWWVLVPASAWIVYMLLEMFGEYAKRINNWSMFAEQIKFLSKA
jgi:hypothetical protein